MKSQKQTLKFHGFFTLLSCFRLSQPVKHVLLNSGPVHRYDNLINSVPRVHSHETTKTRLSSVIPPLHGVSCLTRLLPTSHVVGSINGLN